jgi:thiamine monophosphate synthase
VFATSSKPGAAAAGVEALAAVAAATSLPVLAVGGVTAGQARELARTGAAGCAAIGLFAERDLHTISAALSSLRSAFDSLRPLP